MSIITKIPQPNGSTIRRIYVKGASEMVLESCTHWRHKTTDVLQQIDSEVKSKILTSIKYMADNALRTIVCAYRDLNDNADTQTKNANGVFEIETKDLILHAIFGIYDVVRPEVPGAISKCKYSWHE